MNKGIKKVLTSYIFEGIILILVGIAMIIWPKSALNLLCIIVGIIVGVLGIFKIVDFIVSKYSKSVFEILFGVILLSIGIALIVAPSFFIAMFQYITAIILICGAIMIIVEAVRYANVKKFAFVLSILFAILLVALAIVIFINPVEFASFITILYGISLIIAGVALIVMFVSYSSQHKIKK